jgi:hypothetical protein
MLRGVWRATVATGLTWAGLEAHAPEHPKASAVSASPCRGAASVRIQSDQIDLSYCVASAASPTSNAD